MRRKNEDYVKLADRTLNESDIVGTLRTPKENTIRSDNINKAQQFVPYSAIND